MQASMAQAGNLHPTALSDSVQPRPPRQDESSAHLSLVAAAALWIRARHL